MDEPNEPPRMWTKTGERQMPSDIWDTASEIVAAVRGIEDSSDPDLARVDGDDFLRTLIATALLKEREGWGRRQ